MDMGLSSSQSSSLSPTLGTFCARILSLEGVWSLESGLSAPRRHVEDQLTQPAFSKPPVWQEPGWNMTPIAELHHPLTVSPNRGSGTKVFVLFALIESASLAQSPSDSHRFLASSPPRWSLPRAGKRRVPGLESPPSGTPATDVSGSSSDCCQMQRSLFFPLMAQIAKGEKPGPRYHPGSFGCTSDGRRETRANSQILCSQSCSTGGCRTLWLLFLRYSFAFPVTFFVFFSFFILLSSPELAGGPLSIQRSLLPKR